MKRALSCLGLVLLIGSAACGDDTSSDATDADTDSDDASVSPAQGMHMSGSSNCPEYEPLSDAIARFAGNWLIDDADYNHSCSNAALVVIEGYPSQGVPPDPARNSTCPQPAALFQIANSAVKDCLSPPPGCTTFDDALTFFIHAHAVTATHGAREDESASEKLIARSGNDWNVLDEHIFVDLGTTQDDDVLNTGGQTNLKRTAMLPGECTAP
jgi:hypothetical protein